MSERHLEEQSPGRGERDAVDTIRRSIKDLREAGLDDLAERLEAAADQAAENDE